MILYYLFIQLFNPTPPHFRLSPLSRFYCDIPDEFLFSQTVNLTEIAKAVKIGEGHGDEYGGDACFISR